MRTDDIIALAIFTTAGVAAYLLYTKQIEWPFGDIPNPFDSGTKKEEEDVKDDIKDSSGLDEEGLGEFLADPFKEGKKLIDDIIIPKNLDFKKPKILDDYFKPKKNILDNIVDGANNIGKSVGDGIKGLVTPTIIPKNKDFKMPFVYEDYKGAGEGSCEGIERYCDQVRLFKAQLPPKYRHCKCD